MGGQHLLECTLVCTDLILQLKQMVKAKTACSCVNLMTNEGQHLRDVDTLVDAGLSDGANVRAVIMTHRLIMTACADGRIRVWDMTTGSCQRTLQGSPGGLLDAAFSPRGSHVVTGSRA